MINFRKIKALSSLPLYLFCALSLFINHLYASSSDDELPQSILNIENKKHQELARMDFMVSKAILKLMSSDYHISNLIKDRLEFIYDYLKSNQSKSSKKEMFDLYYQVADVEKFLDDNIKFKSLKRETIQLALVRSDINSLQTHMDNTQKGLQGLESSIQRKLGTTVYSPEDPEGVISFATRYFNKMLDDYNRQITPSLVLPTLLKSTYFNQVANDLEAVLTRGLLVQLNDKFQLNRDDEIRPLPDQIVDLTEMPSVEVEIMVPEKPIRVTPTRFTLPKKSPRKFDTLERKADVNEISIREASFQKQGPKEESGSQAQGSLVLSEKPDTRDTQELSQDGKIAENSFLDEEQLSEGDSQGESHFTERYPSDDLYLEDLTEKELKKRMQACSTKPSTKTTKQKKKKGTRKVNRFEKSKKADSSETLIAQSTLKKKETPKGMISSFELQSFKLASAEAPPRDDSQGESKSIYLTPRAIDTFERMNQSHYGEKVTISEYLNLLKDFIELNSKGFLKKVVQLKKNRSGSEVNFNLGEGESLLFISRENQKAYLSFHYPHDHDGNNHRKVPKEYRDEYMRVFKTFQIQYTDLIPVRRVGPEKG